MTLFHQLTSQLPQLILLCHKELKKSIYFTIRTVFGQSFFYCQRFGAYLPKLIIKSFPSGKVVPEFSAEVGAIPRKSIVKVLYRIFFVALANGVSRQAVLFFTALITSADCRGVRAIGKDKFMTNGTIPHNNIRLFQYVNVYSQNCKERVFRSVTRLPRSADNIIMLFFGNFQSGIFAPCDNTVDCVYM